VARDAFGTLNDQVVVYGTASRSVAPDVAMLDVSVKDVDADPGAAFERCVPRLNEVVARLSVLVGGAGQVTTGNVGVHRDYDSKTRRSAWSMPPRARSRSSAHSPSYPRDVAVGRARG
jgi:uncharacterized protein YggE